MRNRFATTFRVALLLAAFLAAGQSPQAIAQISGDGAAELLQAAQTNPMLLLRQRLSQASLAASAVPFEGVVDDQEYVVGPGDSFRFSIDGQDAAGSAVSVGADGRIAIPDAGLVEIGGMTLEEARNVMVEALSTYYEGSEADASLVQSRQFYVHVTGAVPVPGRYLALPVARVANALEYAFADTTALPITNRSFQPSLRNIEVRRTDGSTINVDLIRYLASGDTSVNPYLRDGDVIHVPAHNPEYGSISIGGHVPYPGLYEFSNGDTLGEILNMAGGIRSQDGAEMIQVSRVTDDGLTAFSFDVTDVLGGEEAAFAIHARDVISITERDEERGLVRIDGQVTFPGTYPIIDGETTLQQLIVAAGGLREDALIRGAFLERRSLADPSDMYAPERADDARMAAAELMRADTTAIFQRLRLTDLDYISRSYFIQELSIQNRVSMDVEAVVSGSADDVHLRAGDRFVVPKDLGMVYVFGQVSQPGFIPLMAGQGAEYYIAKAGGRSESARRTLVVDPSTGEPSLDLTRDLQSGDMVFVDRDEKLADSAELQRLILETERARSDARIRTLQTVVQGLGTLVSAILLIVTIRRN